MLFLSISSSSHHSWIVCLSLDKALLGWINLTRRGRTIKEASKQFRIVLFRPSPKILVKTRPGDLFVPGDAIICTIGQAGTKKMAINRLWIYLSNMVKLPSHCKLFFSFLLSNIYFSLTLSDRQSRRNLCFRGNYAFFLLF